MYLNLLENLGICPAPTIFLGSPKPSQLSHIFAEAGSSKSLGNWKYMVMEYSFGRGSACFVKVYTRLFRLRQAENHMKGWKRSKRPTFRQSISPAFPWNSRGGSQALREQLAHAKPAAATAPSFHYSSRLVQPPSYRPSSLGLYLSSEEAKGWV